MASTSEVTGVDIDQQRLALERIEQEKADHALANRLFAEQFDFPGPRPGSQAYRRMSHRRGGARAPPATNRTRNTADSTTGGPIRNTRRRGTNARGRAAPRARRNNRNAQERVFEFNGNQVQVRNGNQVVDITANVYFPDDEDDSDFVITDDEEEVRSSSSSSSSDSEDSEPEVRIARGPEISGHYIRQLLNQRLLPDNPRNDPTFRVGEIVISSDDDDEFHDASDDSIQILDDSDVIIDEPGPVRADRNHIDQPIFAEDRAMYDRELELYHDEEYAVPPPQAATLRGKPVQPDSTWGECTICSNPPVKPQGCSKCLQYLGCADCVNRWFKTRKSSQEGPSCPLCRACWLSRPGVNQMKTIDKKRQKVAAQSVPCSSTSSSSASPPI